MRTFEITTEVGAAKRVVLAHAASMHGVNRELRPLVRMTAPRAFAERSLFEAPTGQTLFRSWLLLGGVLPVDFDAIALESIDPESGFVESSTMLSIARWRHERRVEDVSAHRARVVDRLSFVPRLPFTGGVIAIFVERLFRHRHANLVAIFGS